MGLHFLSFCQFGLSFPYILVFWAVISCHFWPLGFHFLAFPLILFFPGLPYSNLVGGELSERKSRGLRVTTFTSSAQPVRYNGTARSCARQFLGALQYRRRTPLGLVDVSPRLLGACSGAPCWYQGASDAPIVSGLRGSSLKDPNPKHDKRSTSPTRKMFTRATIFSFPLNVPAGPRATRTFWPYFYIHKPGRLEHTHFGIQNSRHFLTPLDPDATVNLLAQLCYVPGTWLTAKR